MRKAKALSIARPIKVIQNTRAANRGNQWGRIKCAKTGVILHTGRLPYIVRTARNRYNHEVELS